MFPRRSSRLLSNLQIHCSPSQLSRITNLQDSQELPTHLSVSSQQDTDFLHSQAPQTSASQDEMNIELSTEQLISQFDPDHTFTPSFFLSQEKGSLEASTSLSQVPDTVSISSQSSSQIVPNDDWRFNDPNLPTVSTNPSVYDPANAVAMDDLLNTSVAYTPQPTPPRSPILSYSDNSNSNSNNDTDQSLDPSHLPSQFQAIHQSLELFHTSMQQPIQTKNIQPDIEMESLPDYEADQANSVTDILQLLSELDGLDLPNHSPNPSQLSDFEDALPNSHPVSPDAPVASPTLDEANKESLVEENTKSSIASSPAPKAVKSTKSTRGRKRKLEYESKTERKREQNAIAAKRYRQKKQEEQEKILQQKQKLEKEVQLSRDKMKSKLNQRNVVLFMLYELALEKGCGKIKFPSWMEEVYKANKDGSI